MKFLYNSIILFLRVLLKSTSLFHSKARNFVDGRRNLFKNLSLAFSGNTAPVVWIHCASLGEFEQGRPVIELLKKEYPNHKIVLTFFSPSGYQVRKDYPLADYVSYLPWDTKKSAKRFLDIINPSLALFIKYEFWFHFMNQLKKRNIPVLSVSAIFRETQVFFKSYGFFPRKILKTITWFFVQNDTSLRLLNSIGLTNVTRAGDTRFDRVVQLSKQNEENEVARKFKNNQKVMVIGSCWPEDLEILIPFINEEHALKFIIAPHEINDTILGGIEKAVIGKTIRYSQVGEDLNQYQVLLIDNVGMLAQLYKYGEYAYVGGAFGKGLHNILEAACQGIPVFFGSKNYKKFQEAVDLTNLGGAFEVHSFVDMSVKYKAVCDPRNFSLACEINHAYVNENLGATQKIMEYCKTILQPS